MTDQLFDPLEAQLRANPADEGDVEGTAVKLAGKIEQVHLEERRPVAEGRPAAEFRAPIVDAALEADPHRIDAVLEAARRIELHVGGRVAEIAPALVAVDYG